ncbi:spliceosome-associated protein 130 A [Tanacetum coccineum]
MSLTLFIGKFGCRRIVPGQYLALDPKGRALMITACEKQKLVYVLSRDSAANLMISLPLETHKSCTVTYSIVGVDCGWDNPRVDAGANMLVVVPGGGDGPSGVLVYAENFVIYKNQDPGHPDVCAVIPRRALPAERRVLIVSATMHIHKSMFFFLLQTEYRDVFKLPGVQTAFWTVKKNINDEFDAYIVVSFANATLVLSIGGETIEEVSDSGLFLGTTPSLKVSMIGDDSLMQVHPTGIRHIKKDGRIDEWRTPGKQTIVKVGYNRFQVVIALSGNTVP